MLTSFGIFWGAEGAGAHRPRGDAALLVIVPSVLIFSLLLARAFRSPCSARSGGGGMTGIRDAVAGVWRFIAADDWSRPLVWSWPLG